MVDKDIKILSTQLKRHTEKLDILKKSYEYNEAVTKYNEVSRNFTARWADYKREQKEKEEQDGLTVIQTEIKNTEQHIKELNKELKNEPGKSESYVG